MRRLGLAAPLLAALCFLAPTSARPDSGKPISVGLFTPIQIVPESQGVSAFRLSLIYGRNAFLTGLDIGLVNTTSGQVTGLQWGLVGIVGGSFTGWQDNVVNVTGQNFVGLQWGLYNQANHTEGLQLGLVNNTVTMNGVQIGLINIIHRGGMLPLFPIFNFSFK